MRTKSLSIRSMAGIGLALLLVLPVTGCDTDEYDHDPPEGKGTLYIDNNTSDGMDVYISGAKVPGVGSGDKRYYDLEPGLYRVSLAGDDTDRSFSDDVDVLEGRRTIMDVTNDFSDYRRYDVYIYFDS